MWVLVLAGGIVAPGVLVAGTPNVAPKLPRFPRAPESTRLYDVKGRLIATLHGEENRIVVSRKQIPRHTRQAVLAAEDHRFFEHSGVSVPAIVRALRANLQSDRIVQGGSTITQQYVRNALSEVGRERTLGRKMREAMIAVQLEEKVSKHRILQRYLNTVYFGRGAYGVEAASRTYFGKPARRLKVWESAFLAGIIRAPEAYAANRKAALKRRNKVLRDMAELGFITPARLKAATRQKLRIRGGRYEKVRAAHFVEYVRRVLRQPRSKGGFGLSDREILTGGLRVYTTLDLDMQRAAERAVTAVLDRSDDPEVGLASMTTSGEIRALVGGRTSFTSIEAARGFNYATQIVRGGVGRQAGSAFKPFTLAAFVRAGYSVNNVFPAPSRISVRACPNGDRPWSPANYGNTGFGSLGVVQATALSVNTVYAQMVALVGPEKALEAARDAGITSAMSPVCSITLGVFGVTPLEMARAYATFAAHGRRPEVISVLKVVGPEGRVVARRKPRSKQTIERHVADVVSQVLTRVMCCGTGRPAAISRTSAGKTGTTDSRRDVWFAGYTPHPGLSTAVWVGHPPRNGYIKPMYNLHGEQATGGRFPGRIWRYYMDEAVRAMPYTSFAPASFSGRFAFRPRVSYCRYGSAGGYCLPAPQRPRLRYRPPPPPAPEPKPEPTPSAQPQPTTKPKPRPKPEPSPPDPEPTPSEAGEPGGG